MRIYGKSSLKLLGSIWKPGRSAPKRKQQQMTQNLGLGATRGERIKIKEVRRYAENPPKDVCF